MRILRDEDGRVAQVEVTRWPSPRGGEPCRLWRVHLAQEWEELALRYDFGDPQPEPARWDETQGVEFIGEEGAWSCAYGTLGTLDAESVRRIRWALLAAGLVGRPLFPLFRNAPLRCDPVPVLVDRDGSDPEIFAEVRKAATELRNAWGRSRQHSGMYELRKGLQERLDRIVTLLRPRVPGDADGEVSALRLAVDPGDPSRGTTFQVQVEVGCSTSPGGAWLVLYDRETTDLARAWKELWSTDPVADGFLGPRKAFTFLSEATFGTWAGDPARIEPGELSVGEEEIDLFRMLGEPSPFALPGPDLVAWLAARE